MIERTGNIWDCKEKGYWMGVPTNGILKKDGSAVMGKGLAGAVASLHPAVPQMLGSLIRSHGNEVFFLEAFQLFTFPTKDKWWEPSSLALIKRSAHSLFDKSHLPEHHGKKFVLPRVGCGEGLLSWDEVRPALEYYLVGSKFLVVHREATP